MAIALVSAGAMATGAPNVTPAFGVPTTAGNLLIAAASGNGTNRSMATTASGWIQAVVNVSGIWYKPNCGASETAPSFTDIGGGNATLSAAVLAEFSGADTSTPLDHTAHGGSNGIAAALNGIDTSTSDLLVLSCLTYGSKSGTCTFARAYSPTGGTETNVNNGATKALFFLDVGYYLIGGNGGSVADTVKDTSTLSTGTAIEYDIYGASFNPAADVAPAISKPFPHQSVPFYPRPSRPS